MMKSWPAAWNILRFGFCLRQEKKFIGQFNDLLPYLNNIDSAIREGPEQEVDQ